MSPIFPTVMHYLGCNLEVDRLSSIPPLRVRAVVQVQVGYLTSHAVVDQWCPLLLGAKGATRLKGNLFGSGEMKPYVHFV